MHAAEPGSGLIDTRPTALASVIPVGPAPTPPPPPQGLFLLCILRGDVYMHA